MKPIAWGYISLFLLLAACTTVGSMHGRQGAGVVRTFDFPYEQALDASLEAAKLQNLELEEGGRDDHYVILKRIATKHSEGELVAMFFTDKGDRTDLEIVSKRRFALNIFAKNWTASLFRAIDMELGIPPQE